MPHLCLEYCVALRTTYTHWLPIVTYCPVNRFPDLIFVEVTFRTKDASDLRDLYEVRRVIRKLLAWRTMYMEECAERVLVQYPDAASVKVRLAFNKHMVTAYKKDY